MQSYLNTFADMEKRIVDALQVCPLFADMSQFEIEMTLGNTSHRIVEMPAHEVYALAGMPCRYVDIVVDGGLICRMASLSGKQVEVSRLRMGNLVAPAFIFAKKKELPVSIETEGKVTLLRIMPVDLKRLIDNDDKLRMNFIRILSNIDVFLTHKLKVLSLFTIREKVAYMLLELSGEQGGNEIILKRSRQEIADSFGIQKFSLLRVLADFERDGILKVNGKQITIIDRKRILL